VPKVTLEILERGRRAGGWTRDRLKYLGVLWPLEKGWQQKLAGKEVTVYQLERFLGLPCPSRREPAAARQDEPADAATLCERMAADSWWGWPLPGS
jgi:hypothetical protein